MQFREIPNAQLYDICVYFLDTIRSLLVMKL